MPNGLVLGKFLPYHEGHAHLIRAARAQVDELTVLVCSIAAEPIPGTLRYEWVAASHPDCRVVHVAEEVPQAPGDSPDFWPIWTDLIHRYAGDVDLVFTSEDYGDELARRLGARHVCVDRARRIVPASGTAIRDDPMGNWTHIPPVVRPYFVRRIAIMGAESTGKTTLARELAERFDTAWVPEYGREYTETRDVLNLTLGDFEAIGRGQAAAEDAAARTANKMLFCDTELLTTCTWSMLIARTEPAWLSHEARRRHYHDVFLLGDDVPWVDDGTRVLQDRRALHQRMLRAALEGNVQPYHELRGSFESRMQRAVELAEAALATRTRSQG